MAHVNGRHFIQLSLIVTRTNVDIHFLSLPSYLLFGLEFFQVLRWSACFYLVEDSFISFWLSSTDQISDFGPVSLGFGLSLISTKAHKESVLVVLQHLRGIKQYFIIITGSLSSFMLLLQLLLLLDVGYLLWAIDFALSSTAKVRSSILGRSCIHGAIIVTYVVAIDSHHLLHHKLRWLLSKTFIQALRWLSSPTGGFLFLFWTHGCA